MVSRSGETRVRVEKSVWCEVRATRTATDHSHPQMITRLLLCLILAVTTSVLLHRGLLREKPTGFGGKSESGADSLETTEWSRAAAGSVADVDFSKKGGISCHELATRYPEPYTAEYYPTGGKVSLEGPVWAFYKHTGEIKPEDLERADNSSSHDFVRMKILGGKVFFGKQSLSSVMHSRLKKRVMVFLSGVLAALEWYHIPDVELLFHPDDFTTGSGGPIFQICGNNATGVLNDGFTVPFPKAIDGALGPSQMEVMAACMAERYPPSDRIPKVVWRGTSRPAASILRGREPGPRERAIITGMVMPEYSDIAPTSYFVSSLC